METTNKLNLPQSIADAVTNDPYTDGGADISVTSLIGPARKRRLQIDNSEALVTDVADRIWSLYGQVVHGILERADLKNDAIVAERRLFIDRYGWKLSGQFDRLILFGKTTLQDYKFTSVYAAKDLKPEHEAQANIYKLMLEDHGYHVDKAEIVCILRDWSKLRARNDSGYPSKPVVILDVPIWTKDQVEGYIHDRLKIHGKAQTELPLCTTEERWQSDSVWKVKKKGNKTAVKGHAKHTTEADAMEGALQLTKTTGKEHIVEFHEGEDRRCADYCEASPFCAQWQDTNPNKLGL